MKCIVFKTGLLFDHAEFQRLVGMRMPEIRRKFCVKSIIQTPTRTIKKQIDLYQTQKVNDTEYIAFARNSDILEYLTDLGLQIIIENKVKQGDPIDFGDTDLQLEEFQIKIRDKLESHYEPQLIQKGKSGSILVMNTGLGKSFIAMSLMHRIGMRTLILIPNSSNLKDWKDYLKDIFPNIKVGEYSSKKQVWGDVIIMLLPSALSEIFRFNNMPEIPWFEFYNKIGFIVYDEIHDYITEIRSKIFWRTSVSRVLGLTATPNERADKMDEAYVKFIGPLEYSEKIADIQIIAFKIKVHAIRFQGSMEYAKTIPGINGYDYMSTVQLVAKDPLKIQLCMRILKRILLESEKETGCYVFCKYIDHIHMLYAEAIKSMPNEKIGKLYGEAEDMDKTREESRIIFAGIDYCKQGISIPRMCNLIFYDSVKSRIRQTIGRITRKNYKPELVRNIYDIIDSRTALKTQYSTRLGIYKEKSAEIIEVKSGQI